MGSQGGQKGSTASNTFLTSLTTTATTTYTSRGSWVDSFKGGGGFRWGLEDGELGGANTGSD